MVEIRGISKSFGDVRALDNVNLRIESGRIHVLLGENGAGKSTLMKILYGMYIPDGGTIEIDGKPVAVRNSHHAIRLGIGMVHQHFMLVDEFTGYENVALGFEPRRGFAFDRTASARAVDVLAKSAGIKVDATRKVRTMTVGEKQKIEILKLLYRKSELLILDEPTAVLTPNEVEDLFAMIRELKSQGRGIILITHKLHEALGIADTITVLRDGRVVADRVDPRSVDRNDIAAMMVGREVSLYARHPSPSIGAPRLIAEGISLETKDGCALRDVAFAVREGEILGIAGVDGNGQRELVDAIAGIRATGKRSLKIGDRVVPATTRDVLESGIGFVFEDRSHNGLVTDMTVAENIILGYHRRKELKNGWFLSSKKIRAKAQSLVAEYSIKTSSPMTPVKNLSGGNQQKIVIARVLGNAPEAVVISQPTRGVDIGAMEYIHGAMVSYRDRGNAILLISADLDEVKSLSDRLLIMYDGRIVAEGKPEQFTDAELGLFMTGAGRSACVEADS